MSDQRAGRSSLSREPARDCGRSARILLISHEFHPFVGGIGTLTHGLADGATQLGHEVHVLAPDYGQDNTVADEGRRYAVLRFAGGRFRFSRVHRIVAFGGHVRRAICALRPDLVHAVDVPGHLTLGAQASLPGHPRVGLSLCGSDLLLYKRLPPLLWLFRRAATKTTALFPISRAVRDLCVGLIPEAASKVVVSHPGIAPEWHAMGRVARRVGRTACGARPDDLVIVTVARLVPEKGHRAVLAALSLLERGVRDRIFYAIVGAGPGGYAAKLQSDAMRIGVRVWLPGFQTDREVATIYDAADLYVMLSEGRPTRMEGFGLTYLEAAARGLPSLARDVGGVSDVVLHQRTGVVVPDKADAEVVAEELSALLSDSGAARRQAMGVAASDFARGFTWERDALNVFGRLLGPVPQGDTIPHWSAGGPPR